MDRSPEFYRRVIWRALELETVRVGLCLLLMVVLLVLGLPLELIVILPLLTYAGLRLVGSAEEPTRIAPRRTRPPVDPQEAYRTVQRLRCEITSLGEQVSDEANAKQIRIVDDRFGQILAVIAEDGKYSMSVPLLGLITPTHDLLSRYVKNVRRQLDDAEVHARVHDNLVTINHSCNQLWRQVNRDAVIDLEAMIETIDATLKELDTPMEEAPPSLPSPAESDTQDGDGTDSDLPRLPDDVPGLGPDDEWSDLKIPLPDKNDEPQALSSGPITPASANGNGAGADLEAGLTPRELEVLCLLVDGYSNRQIAVHLFISEGTTKRHVTNILAKLDVPSRSAAAAYAHKRGVCPAKRPPE